MTMENFKEIDFEEDEFAESPSQQQEEPNNLEPSQGPQLPEPQQEEEGLDDLTSEVLRLKGISDINKIKFEDESGAVIERPWDSLSRDEQINILAQQDSIESKLDSDEIKLLNAIRSSGMTVNDYMNQINKPEEAPKQYKVYSLSDEDIYALDLLDKIGSENISNEELTEAVNNAKKNETLFKKTVEGLRKEQIRLQEDWEAQQANEIASKQQEAYNNFATSITSEIRGLNSFAGQDLQLSNEDMDNLAEFMLKLDNDGTSAFGRALQDPKLFTKAAFWLLNEEDIVGELPKQMQDSYFRGYNTAKNDFQNKSKVVYNPKVNKPKNNQEVAFDDDDWY